MKKLQRNFTTPKQSKRLLELGIPAQTADCFYQLNDFGIISAPTPCIISYLLDNNNEVNWKNVKAIPCWSVGRLMEIWKICKGRTWYYFSDRLIDEITIDFEVFDIDFSKLEE